MDRSLAEFLDESGIAGEPDPGALHDAARIRALLIEAAIAAEAVSYSEILGRLGFRFTRPKMRSLCRTLDSIDAQARLDGEPDLAVLVVRESDRLPGQGWWVGRTDYEGDWTGRAALHFVKALQQEAFDYWASREGD